MSGAAHYSCNVRHTTVGEFYSVPIEYLVEPVTSGKMLRQQPEELFADVCADIRAVRWIVPDRLSGPLLDLPVSERVLVPTVWTFPGPGPKIGVGFMEHGDYQMALQAHRWLAVTLCFFNTFSHVNLNQAIPRTIPARTAARCLHY